MTIRLINNIRRHASPVKNVLDDSYTVIYVSYLLLCRRIRYNNMLHPRFRIERVLRVVIG